MTFHRHILAAITEHKAEIEGKSLPQIQNVLVAKGVRASRNAILKALKQLTIDYTIHPTVKQMLDAANREENNSTTPTTSVGDCH